MRLHRPRVLIKSGNRIQIIDIFEKDEIARGPLLRDLERSVVVDKSNVFCANERVRYGFISDDDTRIVDPLWDGRKVVGVVDCGVAAVVEQKSGRAALGSGIKADDLACVVDPVGARLVRRGTVKSDEVSLRPDVDVDQLRGAGLVRPIG